jgi:hypothetical protein
VEVEPVAEDCFYQQVIRRRGCAHSNAEIEPPILAEVYIHRGHNLLLLIVLGIEAGYRAHGSVILHAECHPLGDVVADFEIR